MNAPAQKPMLLATTGCEAAFEQQGHEGVMHRDGEHASCDVQHEALEPIPEHRVEAEGALSHDSISLPAVLRLSSSRRPMRHRSPIVLTLSTPNP